MISFYLVMEGGGKVEPRAPLAPLNWLKDSLLRKDQGRGTHSEVSYGDETG